MTWEHEHIGEIVSLTYPQGTTFDTVIVEDTCSICGSHYIGPREEVAHLMAQHSIIHGKEAEQMVLGLTNLDDNEKREQFESHVVGISHLYEAHADLRTKLLVSLQVCLQRYAGISLSRGDV
jgi:hypothetical protein